MMQLDACTKRALADRRKFHYGNIPELAPPVLVVFDYSPTDNEPPLSIVFDGELGPKCWMSENNTRKIDNDGPSLGHYVNFQFEGRQFYGFSIKPFSQSDFDDVNGIERICRRLYSHIVWPDS